MSTELRNSTATNGHNGHATPMVPPMSPYMLQNPGGGPPAEEPGLKLSSIWHAFRRNWVLGLTLGTPLIALAIIPYLVLEPKERATAFLLIRPSEPRLMFDTLEQKEGSDITSYLRLHATVAQDLLRDENLNLALNRPIDCPTNTNKYDGQLLRELEVFDEEVGGFLQPKDRYEWLKKNLEVKNDGSSQNLPVVFSHESPDVAQAVVNCIVEAYEEGHKKDGSIEEKKRLEKLQKLSADRNAELEERRKEFFKLAKRIGTIDADTYSLEQQLLLEERDVIAKQKLALSFERMNLETKLEELKRLEAQEEEKGEDPIEKMVAETLAEQQRKLDKLKRAPMPLLPTEELGDVFTLTPEMIEEEYRFDATLRGFERQKEELNSKLAELISRGGSTRGQEQYVKDLAQLEEDIEFRKAEIERIMTKSYEQNSLVRQAELTRRQQMYELEWRRQESERLEALESLSRKANALMTENQLMSSKEEELSSEDLEFRISKLKFNEEALQSRITQLMSDFQDKGGEAVQLEAQRADIELLNNLIVQIDDEIKRILFEQNAEKQRVEIAQKALRTDKDSTSKQIAATVGVGAAGFLFPLLLLMWRDISRQHVNDLETVRTATGLTHFGDIPRMSVRHLKNKSKEGSADLRTERAVTESVRGIVAQLIRRRSCEDQNCIMVSSARAGEGKTTASVEIAKMLSRSGQSTLLIDFDLRRARLHDEFEISRSPGVHDVLTGSSNLESAIVQIEDTKLFVLPAGEVEGNVIVESFAGGLADFFETLRTKFDFVIVDCCPILPVVDARIVAQHVDGTILALTRDVSVVPDAIEARDVLRSHGASVIGTIVSGQPVKARYDAYV